MDELKAPRTSQRPRQRSSMGLGGSLFDHLSFRVKFIVAGMAVALPLCVLAALQAHHFGRDVHTARERASAVRLSDRVSDVLISLARHRGLSAAVLTGAVEWRRELADEQRHLRTLLEALAGSAEAGTLRAGGLADPAHLRREIEDLMRLPEASGLERHFAHHVAVINTLLAVLYRSNLEIHPDEHQRASASAYDAAFVLLPKLIEDIGRQRGWGSAMLLRSSSEREMQPYISAAGAALQRLEQLRTDRLTVAELDRLLAGQQAGGQLNAALDAAALYCRESIARVLAARSDDGGARQHFADGTAVIGELQGASDTLHRALLAHTEADLRGAEWGRVAALGVLLALLGALAGLYRALERSTVLRLRALTQAAEGLARGDFEAAVQVRGSDEIATVAHALESMRHLLRGAVEEKAAALAATASDLAKSEFLARWSHDLRTPLAAIVGFARLMSERRGSALAPEQHADLQRIQAAARHLQALVNDVLDMATAQHVGLTLELVEVPAVLRLAHDMALPAARAGNVTLQLSAGAGPGPWVQADRTRLLQALANLVGNAVKYNRAGGSVRLMWVLREHALALEVHDTGPGLAPEQIARLFKPFERLDAGRQGIEGTGLGLHTAERLVQRMGGRILVSSRVGEGSRFAIELAPGAAPPDLATQAQALTAAAAAGAPPAARPALRGHVVYVEDDETNTLLFQHQLARHPGLRLTVLGTTQAARDLAASGAHIDLWVIDGQLPDGDGVDLLAQLRSSALAPAPGVIYSADGGPESAARARAAGAAAWWVKPIELHELDAGLRRWLSEPDPGSPR